MGEEYKVDVLNNVIDITWESEDPSIATVDDGKVVDVSEGTTYIIVKSGELEARIKVVVVAENAIETFTITWLDRDGTV